MKKKFALITALLMFVSSVSCGDKKDSADYEALPESLVSDAEVSTKSAGEIQSVSESQEQTEPETEPPHISPVETLSASLGTQQTIDKIIERTEGSNTIQLPLSDFIEDGDIIDSFTFIVYSPDGSNIGTYKGGCGISVSSDCPAATNEGWYQSEDFTALTQGSYGEIVWNVPEGVKDCVSSGGDVLFGYWWGDTGSIRLDSVICTFRRTRDIPVDGTVSYDVNRSIDYNSLDNTIKIETSEFLPENAVPEAVTYNISSGGSLGKFTGAFGYESSEGYYQSFDTAVFTDNSSVSLTWFVPAAAKNYIAEDGEIMLGYWWSNQYSINLDSVEVKYSEGTAPGKEPETQPQEPENTTGFRNPDEIAEAIKIGWNLGNSLESYNTNKKGISTETGWGNPKTSKAMIQSVKEAGFNAVRIPVTWAEHMDGDTIQTEWLDRVQEIVRYACNEDMFVIINMHHDDYIWFTPDESSYPENSRKLSAIWEQIAERFKDYGDRLIFEGMNEPRTVGSEKEWQGGTPEERAVINKYEQAFIDTVRASGGNNKDRTLIITSYAASAEEAALNDVIIPKDRNIILSVHYYAPWEFSEGKSTVFGDAEKQELSAKFSLLKSKSESLGIPVIIGEFGCVASADDSVRADYYRYYIETAKNAGIKCFIWDNGIFKGESSYGIFYRTNLTWNNTILNAIMKGAE